MVSCILLLFIFTCQLMKQICFLVVYICISLLSSCNCYDLVLRKVSEGRFLLCIGSLHLTVGHVCGSNVSVCWSVFSIPGVHCVFDTRSTLCSLLAKCFGSVVLILCDRQLTVTELYYLYSLAKQYLFSIAPDRQHVILLYHAYYIISLLPEYCRYYFVLLLLLLWLLLRWRWWYWSRC